MSPSTFAEIECHLHELCWIETRRSRAGWPFRFGIAIVGEFPREWRATLRRGIGDPFRGVTPLLCLHVKVRAIVDTFLARGKAVGESRFQQEAAGLLWSGGGAVATASLSCIIGAHTFPLCLVAHRNVERAVAIAAAMAVTGALAAPPLPPWYSRFVRRAAAGEADVRRRSGTWSGIGRS